jgi:heparosan-N-sulfate-glucuronate 5-epimerase
LKKIFYWNRIFKAYILGKTSHLSFWHGEPDINSHLCIEKLGQYYMSFHNKANYNGFLDQDGIPMLDYQGKIGLQYNPIAISQWGLGNYNLWCTTKTQKYYNNFIKSADWLANNLEKNNDGVKVWMHYFDFEYRDILKSPWYSGLAQGQGISLLMRAFKETNNENYLITAKEAFKSFKVSTKNGGINYIDINGNHWIEEYIVNPPTHILNGFIWALWGIYDYSIFLNDSNAKNLFNNYKRTLICELETYDTGFWSLYEHSGTRLSMVASTFYHKLHITQLKIMFELTNDSIFNKYAERWQLYLNNTWSRKRALIQKIIFKVLYY